MTTPGYIYALVNASMPGLVKVGRTSRDPKDRAAELSGATGVATPFLVVYHEHFADSEFAENWVHESLQHQGYRVSTNREFFNAEIVDVIKTIAACEGKSLPGSKSLTDESNLVSNGGGLSPADELFEQAENFYYGCGDELQDYAEAMRLYKQAARLGSSDACIRIGDIYRFDQLNKDKSTIRSLSYYINNKNKSIEYYKKAVTKGNFFGYVGMARAFYSLKEKDNMKKCWMNFFSSAQDSSKKCSLYANEWDFTKLLCDYISHYISNNLEIEPIPQLVTDNMSNLLVYTNADERTLLALAYLATKNPERAKLMVAESGKGVTFREIGVDDYVLKHAPPSAVQRADELLKTVLLQANETTGDL